MKADVEDLDEAARPTRTLLQTTAKAQQGHPTSPDLEDSLGLTGSSLWFPVQTTHVHQRDSSSGAVLRITHKLGALRTPGREKPRQYAAKAVSITQHFSPPPLPPAV